MSHGTAETDVCEAADGNADLLIARMPHSSRNFTFPGLLVSVPLTKGEFSVFLRIDRLQIELPLPAEPAPNAAAALQELLGGKYGEMSTLGNYVFQSFNLRSKSAQHCSCSIACSNAGRGWRCFGRRSRGPDAPAPLIASDYGGALVKLLLVTGPDAGASGASHGYCRMGCSWSLPPGSRKF